MSGDWEQDIDPKPRLAGWYQAERACALPMEAVLEHLDRARRHREALGLGLFRSREREYLGGFIARLVEELRRRAGDDPNWGQIDPEQFDPDQFDYPASPSATGVEVDPILRLQVPDKLRERPLPLLAETGSQEVPASIEPLLDPAVDTGSRKRSRHAPLPQEEPERLPSATEAAFERWVEDLDDSASPRQSIKPVALPPLPDFLLEPFPEADSPIVREKPNRPGPRATSVTPAPALPDRFLVPWNEADSPRRERRPVPRQPDSPPAEEASFLLIVEEDEPRGLRATFANCWRAFRSWFEPKPPKYEQWLE